MKMRHYKHRQHTSRMLLIPGSHGAICYLAFSSRRKDDRFGWQPRFVAPK